MVLNVVINDSDVMSFHISAKKLKINTYEHKWMGVGAVHNFNVT
jgi:hypothetical protein